MMNKMNQNTEYIKNKDKNDKVIETNRIRLLNNYSVSLFVPIKHSTLKLINSSSIYPSKITFLSPNDKSYTQELTQ